MSMIAIPWYFAQADDMVRFGVIYAVTNILALFWVPYSGALTDRYSRKRILIILMSLLGLIILTISFFGYQVEKVPWIWVAAVFSLTFLNYNIHYPTLYAFVHEMTDPEHYGKVTSWIEIQGQLATIMAGAGAALLLGGVPAEGISLGSVQIPWVYSIEPWGIHEIFLLDGISYFLGVLFLFLIPFVSGEHLNKIRTNVWKRVGQGFEYLKDNRYVTIFGFASYVVFMAVIIEGFYLLAPYVNDHLQAGPSVYSAGKTTYALGAVLAGLAIRYIFRRTSLVDSVIIMTASAGALFAAFFFNYSIALFFILAIGLGLCNAGIRIQRVTYLFNKVPNELYGRVNSSFNLGNISARILFIGVFAIPFFQSETGIRWTFIILSLACMVALTVLLSFRKKMLIRADGPPHSTLSNNNPGSSTKTLIKSAKTLD